MTSKHTDIERIPYPLHHAIGRFLITKWIKHEWQPIMAGRIINIYFMYEKINSNKIYREISSFLLFINTYVYIIFVYIYLWFKQ